MHLYHSTIRNSLYTVPRNTNYNYTVAYSRQYILSYTTGSTVQHSIESPYNDTAVAQSWIDVLSLPITLPVMMLQLLLLLFYIPYSIVLLVLVCVVVSLIVVIVAVLAEMKRQIHQHSLRIHSHTTTPPPTTPPCCCNQVTYLLSIYLFNTEESFPPSILYYNILTLLQ